MTLILNTSDAPFDLGKLDFSTTTCLVYSENVVVSNPIHLPGKNLGIFCTVLEVVTTQKKPTILIDVSGANGVSPEAKASGDGIPGPDGRAGGNIWIFVEGLTDKILKTLRLNANGGDGAIGGSTSDPIAAGGAGGQGGDAGESIITPRYILT